MTHRRAAAPSGSARPESPAVGEPDGAETGLFVLAGPHVHTGHRRAAVFDLDRTLIRIPAVIAVVPTLRRAGLLRVAGLWRAMWAQPAYLRRALRDAEVARLGTVVLSVVAGWEAQEVYQAVAAAAPRLVRRIQYPTARALMDAHRAVGDLVVVASSAPSDLVVPIARELDAHIALATTAQLDDDGRYAGELASLCYGPAKADAVRRLAARFRVDLDASSAYSDSVSDVPLLAAVGTPVATNPERSLAAVARQRGWRILHLRDGSAQSPPSGGDPADAAAAVRHHGDAYAELGEGVSVARRERPRSGTSG